MTEKSYTHRQLPQVQSEWPVSRALIEIMVKIRLKDSICWTLLCEPTPLLFVFFSLFFPVLGYSYLIFRSFWSTVHYRPTQNKKKYKFNFIFYCPRLYNISGTDSPTEMVQLSKFAESPDYETSVDLWSNIIAMEWSFPHTPRLFYTS